MNIYEYLLFLKGFLSNPTRVGGVLPSSRYLAMRVVQSVPWNEVRTVAELGAGTGAITRFIREQVSPSTKVLLFERDRNMRDHLKSQFPGFSFHSNASYLIKKMNEEQIGQLDCIICGLPLFNLSNDMRGKLLQQMIAALKPGGMIVSYHYTPYMKKRWVKHLEIEKIEFVPCNLPPAFVYVCRKSLDKGSN
ncbi:class I SAM-dependent methyltransferase [Paenibacillus massiliensis]|uniref:class I SAM-dependent methyltransferase n=1 Tax=Paenibacillus massiliensis TaxID=225917 RepID=UPI00048DB95B|nr:methyltransferase [Paenibacillus massiliensis]